MYTDQNPRKKAGFGASIVGLPARAGMTTEALGLETSALGKGTPFSNVATASRMAARLIQPPVGVCSQY